MRASAASDPRRSGLSPAVVNSWAATCGPTPKVPASAGAAWPTSAHSGFEFGDLAVEEGNLRGEGLEREPQMGLDDVVVVVAERSGEFDLTPKRLGVEAFSQVSRCGHDQRFELVDRPCPVAGGAVAHDLDGPDRLSRPIGGLGHTGRTTRDHGSSRGLSVDGIGLAFQPPGLAVGPVHFDHHDTSRSQRSGETSTPGAGRLDTDGVDTPNVQRQSWSST